MSLSLLAALLLHASPAEATLSLLEPTARGCDWVRVDARTSERRILTTLEVDCQGGTTALSKDGLRGALRFWRGGVSAPVLGRPTFPEKFPSPAFKDRLFEVETATGAHQELPLPPIGELIEFGYDASQRLLGLTVQRVTPEQEHAGFAEVEGQRIVFDSEAPGHPLLAHAFVFRDKAWVRLTTEATDSIRGIRGMVLRKKLGDRASAALDPRFTPGDLDDNTLLDQLDTLAPEQPEGEWSLLKRGGMSLAVWATPFEDDMLSTGLVRRVEGHQALALPGHALHANDLAGVQVRGTWLLVTLADSGGHPRLYRGKTLVWSSETARAVTFWPR
ncbi:hypothetical protein DRW03_07170 [Corallococcus sp. H22C18031201]|nr:hypothetical protein DRW03_07170 [Corallococcus sp. H22C18031201]